MSHDTITIKDLMATPITVAATATLREVLEVLCTEKTNSVLVINEDGTLAGEINVVQMLQAIVPDYTETDAIAAHFVSEEIFNQEIEKAKDMPASDFMITDRATIKEDASLMQAGVIAIGRGQARIPVVDEDNKPIGIITRRGLKKIIARHLDINCAE